SFGLEVLADLLAVLLGHLAVLDPADLAGPRGPERACTDDVRRLPGAPRAPPHHHPGHRLALVDLRVGVRLEIPALDHACLPLVVPRPAPLGVARLRRPIVLALLVLAALVAVAARVLASHGQRHRRSSADLPLGVARAFLRVVERLLPLGLLAAGCGG